MPSTADQLLRVEAGDQRRYRRFEADFIASAWLASDHPGGPRDSRTSTYSTRAAYIDDLSLTGLHFYAQTSFNPGSIIWIRFRLLNQILDVKCIVRRKDVSSVAGQRCFGYGVEFAPCAETRLAVLYVAKHLVTLARNECNRRPHPHEAEAELLAA